MCSLWQPAAGVPDIRSGAICKTGFMDGHPRSGTGRYLPTIVFRLLFKISYKYTTDLYAPWSNLWEICAGFFPVDDEANKTLDLTEIKFANSVFSGGISHVCLSLKFPNWKPIPSFFGFDIHNNTTLSEKWYDFHVPATQVAENKHFLRYPSENFSKKPVTDKEITEICLTIKFWIWQMGSFSGLDFALSVRTV